MQNNDKDNDNIIKPHIFNLIDNYELNKQINKTYSLEFKRHLLMHQEDIIQLFNNYNTFTFASMLKNHECLSILIEFYLENKQYFNSLNYPNLLCWKDLYGQNGLLVCCLFNNYNSAKLFLENDCNPDSTNKNNESCLLISIYGKSFNLIKLLIHYNATITDEIIKKCIILSTPENTKNEHVEYYKITEYLLKKRGNYNKYNSKILNKISGLFPQLFKSKNRTFNTKFKTLKSMYRCHCLDDKGLNNKSLNDKYDKNYKDADYTFQNLSQYLNINLQNKTKKEICKEMAYKLMISHKDVS